MKEEQWDGRKYPSLTEARSAIRTMLEELYNEQRIHSALGYPTPVEYEQKTASTPNGSSIQAPLAGSLRLGPDPAPSSRVSYGVDATVSDATRGNI